MVLLFFLLVLLLQLLLLLQTVELSGGNTAGTTLTGLTARNYLFSIRATNDQGASEFLKPPLLASLPGQLESVSGLVGSGCVIFVVGSQFTGEALLGGHSGYQ